VSLRERDPVIVGVAQVAQRIDDVSEAREPIDLMLEASKKAAEDAGCPALLTRTDSVRVGRGFWAYNNPARAIAERIGSPNAETGLTSLGGNYVQCLTNLSFRDILDGQRDVILVTGAECGRTLSRAHRQGVELAWEPAPSPPGMLPGPANGPESDADTPELFLASTKITRHEAELRRGISRPVQYYPLFEAALRFLEDESIDDHQRKVSELWQRFNQTAVENPHAWIRTPMTAEEIRTPSASNRPVSSVYPKLMNSNPSVDQGAALFVTSAGTARRLGIPESHWVYPHAGTEAWDHLFVSERDNLYSSPAIRFSGRRLLEMAGVEAGDLDFVDLYSCFPSAVQVAARELGLSLERGLTVTGGLTFAGGPLNNYVMHAIARSVELLRQRPGALGLVTANGGMLTKHALCLYSTAAPEAPFQWENVQSEVEATAKREVLLDHAGEVSVESYVVMCGADGPEIAHAACRLPEGARTWANTTDSDLIGEMTEREFCGRKGHVDGNGNLTITS
jgi:acetyl-CoA C-acetyltransferase